MITGLADLVRVHGRDRPDTPALIAGDQTVTYAELDARSNRVAQAFSAAGVGFGDRVAILDRNGLAFFDVVFGLAKLGAVGVPVNWRLTAPEIAHVLTDSGATAVVVGAEFADRLIGLDAAVTVIPVESGGAAPSLDDWAAAHPALDPGVVTGPDDVVLLMYTSGTTGAPKGVMLSNANYVCKTGGVASGSWLLTEDSVSLAVMPLFHMAGSGWAFAGQALNPASRRAGTSIGPSPMKSADEVSIDRCLQMLLRASAFLPVPRQSNPMPRSAALRRVAG